MTMINNEDKDYLDKLDMLLSSYNVDVLGYHNMSIVNTTQEEICKEQTRLYNRIRPTQYDIYNRSLKYFCSLEYELPTTLELLNRLMNFDKLSIININYIITTLKNRIIVDKHNKKFEKFQ